MFKWSAMSCSLVYVLPENKPAARSSKFPAPFYLNFRVCREDQILLQPASPTGLDFDVYA